MKFIFSFILMAVLSFALCLYFPWWTIAIACFAVALLIPQHPGKAFLCGLLSLFVLWAGLSLWISVANDHLLAHKISMLMLKQDNPELLILITGLIGGIVGAFAALSGAILSRKRKTIAA